MNYSELEGFLVHKLDHVATEIVGVSALGRYIYASTIDFGSNESILIQGAMHAREHITADLVCALMREASREYEALRARGTPNIVFVPMVNPDGVELCINGPKSVPFAKRRLVRRLNGGGDFSQFKANANGVDLNNNFDAKWGSVGGDSLAPAAHGYIGPSPMSEPEVQALALLTLRLRPIFTISYHSKGEEIYYRFFNKEENLRRDGKIARLIASRLGYKIKNTQDTSCGGYKDWCVLRLGIPSVTIEVGKDSLSHPIGPEHLSQIYKKNRRILRLLSRIKKEFDDDRKRKIYAKGARRGKQGEA